VYYHAKGMEERRRVWLGKEQRNFPHWADREAVRPLRQKKCEAGEGRYYRGILIFLLLRGGEMEDMRFTRREEWGREKGGRETFTNSFKRVRTRFPLKREWKKKRWHQKGIPKTGEETCQEGGQGGERGIRGWGAHGKRWT